MGVRPWPLEAKSATANRKISVQVEGFEVARLMLKNQDFSAGSRVLQWPLEAKSATANRQISVQVAGFEVARSRQEKKRNTSNILRYPVAGLMLLLRSLAPVIARY